MADEIQYSIEVAETLAGLRRMEGLVDLGARKAFRAALDAGKASAKGTTLFKDGDQFGHLSFTRDSIESDYGDGHSGQLVAKGAAHFLEWGTKPHTITAKKKPFLIFEMAGELVAFRSVKHPGTKERPFMRQAQEQMSKTLDYGMDFYLEQAMSHG